MRALERRYCLTDADEPDLAANVTFTAGRVMLLRFDGRDLYPGPWVTVLAGGDGTRLRPLVDRLHADGRPKQFASLEGSGPPDEV